MTVGVRSLDWTLMMREESKRFLNHITSAMNYSPTDLPASSVKSIYITKRSGREDWLRSKKNQQKKKGNKSEVASETSLIFYSGLTINKTDGSKEEFSVIRNLEIFFELSTIKFL